MKIADMESVPPETAAALARTNVLTTEDLLERAGPAAARAALARESGVSDETLLILANRADLMRIHKLVEPFILLLEALDLASRDKLATLAPGELLRTMRRKNVELTLVRSIYPESDLAVWIADASKAPSLVQR